MALGQRKARPSLRDRSECRIRHSGRGVDEAGGLSWTRPLVVYPRSRSHDGEGRPVLPSLYRPKGMRGIRSQNGQHRCLGRKAFHAAGVCARGVAACDARTGCSTTAVHLAQFAWQDTRHLWCRCFISAAWHLGVAEEGLAAGLPIWYTLSHRDVPPDSPQRRAISDLLTEGQHSPSGTGRECCPSSVPTGG